MGLGHQIVNGWQWFVSSLKILKNQPFSFVAVSGIYVMTLGLLGSLPWVGILLAGLFWPFGTLLIAKGGKDSLEGRKPILAILVEAWADRERRIRLFRVGLLYSMMILLVSLVWELLAAGDIAQWKITEAGRVDWSSAKEHVPYGAMVAALCAYIPCAMALWFAPLLVYLKNLPLPKALFFSFFGCLSNLLSVAIALALAFATTGILLGLIAVLIVVANLSSISMFLLLPVSLVSSALVYGTYYPMWKTLFSEVSHERDEPQPF